jgi:membrane protease YdiL (CAAX protease family)
MPEPQTIAVLRDVFVMAMMALAVALPLYAAQRHFSDSAWNVEGNVLSRPYGVPDAVVGLLLIGVMFGGFFTDRAGESSGADVLSESDKLAGVLVSVVFMLLLCLVVIAHLWFIRQLNPAEMFGLRQMSIKRALRFAVGSLILTVIGGVVAMLALMGLNDGPLPGGDSPQDAVKTFAESGSMAYRVSLAVMAIVTAPLTEELLFRGFLYGVVKRGTDRWFAAVFTAVLFAVVHLHVGTAPQLFLLGMGLAIAYEQSGSLLVPIFMHSMFNAWNIAMLAYAASTT